MIYIKCNEKKVIIFPLKQMMKNILFLYFLILFVILYQFPNLLYIHDKTNGIPNYFLLFVIVILSGTISYLGYFYFTSRPL